MSNIENSYAERLQRELECYRDDKNIHELPEIYHYWSNKFLLPIINQFGYTSIEDIFFRYMVKTCISKPDSNVKFISIGTGNCDLEIRLSERLKHADLSNFTLECLDINPTMLDRGKELAINHGVIDFMTFNEVDVNHWNGNFNYDVIIAAHCLHHFVELESIFDKIYNFLSPQGYFMTQDMIGRNGHLRWPEVISEVEKFWKELPSKYKFNRQLNRHEEKFMDWDCSGSAFEGIRAQDILPLLVERFEFELFIGWGGIIDVFIDRSFGHNFNPNLDWDRSFIDRIQNRNLQKLIDGRIKPTQMVAIMSKSELAKKSYWQGLSAKDCIRPVD